MKFKVKTFSGPREQIEAEMEAYLNSLPDLKLERIAQSERVNSGAGAVALTDAKDAASASSTINATLICTAPDVPSLDGIPPAIIALLDGLERGKNHDKLALALQSGANVKQLTMWCSQYAQAKGLQMMGSHGFSVVNGIKTPYATVCFEDIPDWML